MILDFVRFQRPLCIQVHTSLCFIGSNIRVRCASRYLGSSSGSSIPAIEGVICSDRGTGQQVAVVPLDIRLGLRVCGRTLIVQVILDFIRFRFPLRIQRDALRHCCIKIIDTSSGIFTCIPTLELIALSRRFGRCGSLCSMFHVLRVNSAASLGIKGHRVSLGRILCIEGDIIFNRMLIKCRPSKLFIQIPTAECVFRLSFHRREHHRSTLSIVSCRIELVCTFLIIPQFKCCSSKCMTFNLNLTVYMITFFSSISSYIVSRNFEGRENNSFDITLLWRFSIQLFFYRVFIRIKNSIPVRAAFT